MLVFSKVMFTTTIYRFKYDVNIYLEHCSYKHMYTNVNKFVCIFFLLIIILTLTDTYSYTYTNARARARVRIYVYMYKDICTHTYIYCVKTLSYIMVFP